MSRLIGFTALSLAAACSAAFAQPIPQFHSGTSTVLVEAVVTGKKSDFPKDLTAKDFRVWQDGKEQAITSLSFEPQSKSPHFLVFFLDDTQIPPAEKARALQSVSRFIDASAAPDRQMGIVRFDGSLRVAQGFTDDAGRLKDALTHLGSGGAGPALGDAYSSRNVLQGLANLAKSLSALPGRKTIVLLTGGFPLTADLKARADAAVEESAKSDVAIYPVNLQLAAGDNTAPIVLQSPREMARRPLAPRALQGPDDAPPPIQDPVESSLPLLLTLANRTGGFVVTSSDNLLAQLQRIGEEQTEYYVLSYTPPESKEGTCHPVRVSVDRRGATVRARSAYCAVKPPDLSAEAPGIQSLEKRASGSDSGVLSAAIALPYFYASTGVARVHLVAELSPAGLKFENVNGKRHAELNILGIASASDSNIAARFNDTLKFDLDDVAAVQKFQRSPIHYEKELKIAPGSYAFVLALSAGPESFGKFEVPLVIDPWDPGSIALSSIILSRDAHPAPDLNSISALIQAQAPFVAQGTEFVPAASREFSHDDDGFFYFELYSADPAAASVRVRVLDPSGMLEWDSGALKLPASEGSRKSVSAAARLPLPSLAAGSHRLQVTASDPSGKQTRRTADFDVK